MPALAIATQRFALADLDLTTKAFLAKPGLGSYTRRHRGYCELRLEIEDPQDAVALEAAAYTRALRWWRNGVNRFNGQIVDVDETANGLAIIAKDPYFNLGWRRVRAAVTYDGDEDGEIAWNLIELQNGYSTTRLQQGPADATEIRDEPRKYEQGDRVDEKIDYLARIEDGFGFTIDAVDGVAGVFAEFTVNNPAGTLKPKARFEFGPGTRGTLEDYGRRPRHLINRKSAIDETNLDAAFEAPNSPALHGLWEDERGHMTTDGNDELLGLLAKEGVMDAVLYDLSLAPSPEAPQLFTDFDVGDPVPVLIRRRGVTIVNGNFPVELATVAFDADSGAEMLDELVVELPRLMDARDVDARLLERVRQGGDRGRELLLRQLERRQERVFRDFRIRLGNLERRRTRSGLTVLEKVGEIVVSNTATETTILDTIIPASSLGVDGQLHMKMIGIVVNNTLNPETFRPRVQIAGGNVARDFSPAIPAGAHRAWTLNAVMGMRGVQNSQGHQVELRVAADSAAANGIGDWDATLLGDGLIYAPKGDTTTVDLTYVVKVQLSVADPLFEFTLYNAVVWSIA